MDKKSEASLHKEPNLKRRAQRVSLPVGLEVEGHLYETKDISVFGIGLDSFHRALKIGEEVEARLILPFKEASLALPVTLVCRRAEKGNCGFEFKDVTASKRRAIRQYVEFAIEGRLDDLETVMSSLALGTIESPVVEGLALAEEEQAELYRKFKRHMWFWIGFGSLVLLAFLAFVVYNTVFTFGTFGVVAGRSYQVFPKTSGTIERVNVKVGDFVSQGNVLFEFYKSGILSNLERVREKIKELEEYKPVEENEVLKALKGIYLFRKTEYEKAKKLYDQRVISTKDLSFAESAYLRAKLRYMEELARSNRAVPAALSKMKARVEELKLKEETLLRKLEALRIKAPISGWITEIRFPVGSYVTPTNAVIVMESQPLFVLVEVPDWELTRMSPNAPVKIYSPLTGKYYAGKISSMDVPGARASSKHTLVRIGISGVADIPIHSKVKVWFTNKAYHAIRSLL